MSPELVAIVVGLLTGCVADFLVKDRGFGMTADLALGLVGGLVAIIVVQAAGNGLDASWFAMTLVSLVGVAGLIGAQRRSWTPPGSEGTARRMRL